MKINKNKIISSTVIFAAISIFGLNFDGFWHLTRGRETFLALPHLFVYGGLIGALFTSWQGYRAFSNRAWLWLFRSLALIPLTAVLDEVWHRWNGVETIGEISIIWSPPHILFLLAALSALMILSVIVSRSEKPRLKNLSGTLVLGMFLNTLVIMMMPVLPIGPFTILGAAGMGVLTAATIVTYFISRKLFPDFPSATATAIFFLLFQSIIWDSNIYIASHLNFLHIPMWLMSLMFVGPAWLIDSTSEFQEMTRGMAAGLLASLLFFGLGAYMIPSAGFTYYDLWVGSLLGALGGLLAGLLDQHSKEI